MFSNVLHITYLHIHARAQIKIYYNAYPYIGIKSSGDFDSTKNLKRKEKKKNSTKMNPFMQRAYMRRFSHSIRNANQLRGKHDLKFIISMNLKNDKVRRKKKKLKIKFFFPLRRFVHLSTRGGVRHILRTVGIFL